MTTLLKYVKVQTTNGGKSMKSSDIRVDRTEKGKYRVMVQNIQRGPEYQSEINANAEVSRIMANLTIRV